MTRFQPFITNCAPGKLIQTVHSDEEFLKYAKEYIMNHTGGNSRYCGRLYGPSIQGFVWKGIDICYNYVDAYTDQRYDYFTAGLYISKNKYSRTQGYIAFKDWILSRETSPWRRAILEDIELIEDNDAIHGFILGPKTMLEGFPYSPKPRHNNILLNFLIATRMVNSFPENVQLWYKAVQMGVSPEKAFFLARNFNANGKQIHKKPVRDIGSYAFAGDIDIKSFEEGKFRANTGTRGGAWSKKDWAHDYGRPQSETYFRTDQFNFVNKEYMLEDEFKTLVIDRLEEEVFGVAKG